MSGDVAYWLARLAAAAPAADRPMLRILARMLAAEVDTDALLVTADAIDEAVTEIMIEGHAREAAGLVALSAIIRAQAAGRANPRGNFW